MKKSFLFIAMLGVFAASSLPASAQLDKGGPKKDDPPKNSGSGGAPPKQSPPPASPPKQSPPSGGGLGNGAPPKQSPPPASPPKQSPPSGGGMGNGAPPKQSPPPASPPKQSPPSGGGMGNGAPPKQSPPPASPPKQSPPSGGGMGNGAPPKQSPPPASPPKQSPPSGGGMGNGAPPKQSPPPASPPKQSPPSGGGMGNGAPPKQSPPGSGGGLGNGAPPKQAPPATNPPRQLPPGNDNGLGTGGSGKGSPPMSDGRGNSGIGSGNRDQIGGGLTLPPGRTDGPKPGFGDTGRIFDPRVPVADQFKRPSSPQGPAFAPRTGGYESKGKTNIPFGDRRASETPRAFPTPSGPRIKDPYFFNPTYYGSHCRYGYTHYFPWWSDWYFGYRWYIMDPWAYRCYFSPYYWYIAVPAYIRIDRVIIITPIVFAWYDSYFDWRYCGYGINYRTYYGGYGYTYPSNYRPVDRALSSLVDAFRYEEPHLLDQFLAPNSQVNIYIDGNYAYTLRSEDYYDMTADLIYNTYTTGFEIERVRRARSGEYQVLARHDFVDPNNVSQTVWMTFTLREYRGSFYIIEAGTSRYRPSF